MCAGARVWLSAGVCVVWFAGRAVGDCPLPQHPAHGHHQPLGGDCGGSERPLACDGTPGTPTPEDWVLTVRCDPGYQLPDPSAADVPSVCTNGVWSIPQLPQCVIPDLLKNDRERCTVPEPPPNSQYRLLAEECGGDNLPSGSAVPHDCLLLLNCAPGYRRRRMGTEDLLTLCSNKTWNPRIPNDLCIKSSYIDTNPGATAEVNKGSSTVPLPVISSTGCVLPKAPPYRKFCSLAAGCEDCSFYNGRCFIPPGSMVDKVRVVCAPGYTPETSSSGNIAICQTNGWYPSIPECLKLCHPLVSEQLLLFCQFGTNMVDCSQPALPNTTVTMKCRPSFSEYPNLKSQGAYRVTITCGQSGQWSENLPLCKPGCGVSKEVQTFSPTIFNGTQAHIGFFPWHAGLYYPSENDGKVIWEQRCGGSLINDWVILTAAHCVAKVDDASRLRIALGKYYRSWDTYEPTEEKRNVSEIIKSPQYTSSTYTFDIALVLLKEKIKLGEYIMPVCLDFDEGNNEIFNNNLYVVGWGKTDVNEQASENLLYNTVKAMTDDKCRQAIPAFYTSFEKICALKNNSESATQGGDSGGGLTAINKEGLHTIVGIVSTRLGRVSLFTKIKWKTNIDWIASGLAQFKNKYGS